MTKAASLCVVASLGVLAALDPPFTSADPPVGQPATVYVTQTRTVARRVEGKPIGWWRSRAVANRRALNASMRHRIVLTRRLHAQTSALRARLRLSGSLVGPFLCIHGFEGSWTDGGAPYWGGLQMDRTFMAEYGPWFYRAWGTADHWPPFVQVAVAEAAYLSGRGFGPWPQTSRMCGL